MDIDSPKFLIWNELLVNWIESEKRVTLSMYTFLLLRREWSSKWSSRSVSTFNYCSLRDATKNSSFSITTGRSDHRYEAKPCSFKSMPPTTTTSLWFRLWRPMIVHVPWSHYIRRIFIDHSFHDDHRLRTTSSYRNYIWNICIYRDSSQTAGDIPYLVTRPLFVMILQHPSAKESCMHSLLRICN